MAKSFERTVLRNYRLRDHAVGYPTGTMPCTLLGFVIVWRGSFQVADTVG